MYVKDEKLIVQWSDVDNYINRVVKMLQKTKDRISGVYGIPRGGLVLAVILSHKLNVPLLSAPCKNCIVVDDIADTGKTLIHYKKSGYCITTMFYHIQSWVVPDYWCYSKDDYWVVYPWEDQTNEN